MESKSIDHVIAPRQRRLPRQGGGNALRSGADLIESIELRIIHAFAKCSLVCYATLDSSNCWSANIFNSNSPAVDPAANVETMTTYTAGCKLTDGRCTPYLASL